MPPAGHCIELDKIFAIREYSLNNPLLTSGHLYYYSNAYYAYNYDYNILDSSFTDYQS